MKKAIAHLAATDPRFAALIGRSRRFDVIANELVRPFDALAESIAYQQLSGKAAATIWGRVRALYPKRKWLDPELVLKTPDETLRACGLSRSKTAALKDLAAKTLDGTVPTRRELVRMTDEEIIERLTKVRGIGRWTVEMLLLFELGRRLEGLAALAALQIQHDLASLQTRCRRVIFLAARRRLGQTHASPCREGRCS